MCKKIINISPAIIGFDIIGTFVVTEFPAPFHLCSMDARNQPQLLKPTTKVFSSTANLSYEKLAWCLAYVKMELRADPHEISTNGG